MSLYLKYGLPILLALGILGGTAYLGYKYKGALAEANQLQAQVKAQSDDIAGLVQQAQQANAALSAATTAQQKAQAGQADAEKKLKQALAQGAGKAWGSEKIPPEVLESLK